MMDIHTFLVNSNFKCIGITGNAGAGKTSLAASLNDDKFAKYSIDWRFIGDSLFRKQLLKAKANNSIHSYIDGCNQFNWWDWDQISKDLSNLQNEKPVTLNAYDRDTGSFSDLIINCDNRKIAIEGALLGPDLIVKVFEAVIFVYTPRLIRLERILEKDAERRNVNEIIARFMITEYSESLYYKHLLETYPDKIFFVNQHGSFIEYPSELLTEDYFIPIPI